MRVQNGIVITMSASKHTRLILSAALLIGTASFIFWPSRPERILAMAKYHEQRGEEGEANGRRMSERLIACGPSAIPPIIDTIREHGIWNRRYAYLPRALERLGEPARDALLQAIDSEESSHARSSLISALHRGFSDFSRFHLWLAQATNNAATNTSLKWQLVHFAGDVRIQYPEAPPLEADETINSEFLEWWEKNNKTK